MRLIGVRRVLIALVVTCGRPALGEADLEEAAWQVKFETLLAD